VYAKIVDTCDVELQHALSRVYTSARGNKLRERATCCGQQFVCCLQQVACYPQHVARPRNNFVDGNKQNVAAQHVALV